MRPPASENSQALAPSWVPGTCPEWGFAWSGHHETLWCGQNTLDLGADLWSPQVSPFIYTSDQVDLACVLKAVLHTRNLRVREVKCLPKFPQLSSQRSMPATRVLLLWIHSGYCSKIGCFSSRWEAQERCTDPGAQERKGRGRVYLV